MTEIGKLCALFDKYAHAKNHATAFTELLDYFLLPFKLLDSQEEQEQQLSAMVDYPNKDALIPVLNLLGELSEDFCDPLGQLYMEKVSNDYMGQYFTPGHVCDLMAQISIDNPEDGKTVLDPACGSGRMLLAAAKINRHLLFYGADIDGVCCKMALANMLMQSLTGEIAHMDSLSNKFFAGYHIHITLCEGYYYPWYREFTNPEESAIWLRPKEKVEKAFPENPIVLPQSIYLQGTLF